MDLDLLGFDGVALAFAGRPRPLGFVGLGGNDSPAALPISSAILTPFTMGLDEDNDSEGEYARLVVGDSPGPLLVFRFRGDVASEVAAPSAFRFGGITMREM